ncbi:MAG: hypothetical protein WC860_04660 [Candidatus Margulisiibacteriota bacterium]|jgi:hypothetical protein
MQVNKSSCCGCIPSFFNRQKKQLGETHLPLIVSNIQGEVDLKMPGTYYLDKNTGRLVSFGVIDVFGYSKKQIRDNELRKVVVPDPNAPSLIKRMLSCCG